MGIESDDRHRLAGHRLVRGPGHAATAASTATTSGSPTRSPFDSDPVRRGGRRVRGARCSPRATCSVAARRSPAPTSAPRATRCSTTQARLLAAQAGLASSPGFFPEEILADLDDERRRLRLPAGRGRRREPGPRWWRPGRAAERQRGRQDGDEAAGRDRHRQRRRAGSARSSRRTRTSTRRSTRTRLTRTIAEVAYDSTAFLFDGSDQMPGEVGAGTFWKDMTAWISGQRGPRHRAEEHRRQLAGQLTLARRRTVAGGAGQRPRPRRRSSRTPSRSRGKVRPWLEQDHSPR